jgi:hypothetical protein
MKITKEEVLYVAHLARLDLDAKSIEKFAGQIDEILGYIPMRFAKIRNGNISTGIGPWPMRPKAKMGVLWFPRSSDNAFEKAPFCPISVSSADFNPRHTTKYACG